MTRARELAKLSNQQTLKIDTTNTRVGIGSTIPSVALDVGTGKLKGDGSQLTGVTGLGTALSNTVTNPLNLLYYTNKMITIGDDTTVTVPSTSDSHTAYTNWQEIAVDSDNDLIISDGDDLMIDVLGLSTTTQATPLTGIGGRVRAAFLTNKAGSGAPQLTYGVEVPVGYGLTGAGGLNVSGVSTITSDINVGVSTAAGVVLKSPNGTKYRIIVADNGTISSVAV